MKKINDKTKSLLKIIFYTLVIGAIALSLVVGYFVDLVIKLFWTGQIPAFVTYAFVVYTIGAIISNAKALNKVLK